MLEKVLKLPEELAEFSNWCRIQGLTVAEVKPLDDSAAVIRALVEEVQARRFEREQFFNGDVTLEEWHKAEDAVTAAIDKLNALNDGLEM